MQRISLYAQNSSNVSCYGYCTIFFLCWLLVFDFFKDSGICSISETKEINILPLIGKKRIKQYLFCHSKISVFQTVICDQLVGHKISLSHDQHLTQEIEQKHESAFDVQEQIFFHEKFISCVQYMPLLMCIYTGLKFKMQV